MRKSYEIDNKKIEIDKLFQEIKTFKEADIRFDLALDIISIREEISKLKSEDEKNE